MIKNVFPIPIWEASYTEYNKEETVEKFYNYLDLVGTNRDNIYIPDSDTTANDRSADTSLVTEMGTPLLFKWIVKQIRYYHDYCQYSKVAPVTDEMNSWKEQFGAVWATSGPKGGHLIHHNHNPALTAGVFYVDASPEQGNLHLLNPNDATIGKSMFQTWDRYPHKHHEVLAETGKLVLFPGWLYHFVPKNPTDKNRLAIGFVTRNVAISVQD